MLDETLDFVLERLLDGLVEWLVLEGLLERPVLELVRVVLIVEVRVVLIVEEPVDWLFDALVE